MALEGRNLLLLLFERNERVCGCSLTKWPSFVKRRNAGNASRMRKRPPVQKKRKGSCLYCCHNDTEKAGGSAGGVVERTRSQQMPSEKGGRARSST